MNKRVYFLVASILVAGAILIGFMCFWFINNSNNLILSDKNDKIVTQKQEDLDNNNLNQESFSFGVQGDSHPERPGKMFNAELYKITLQNANKANLAFYFLMGDDFSIEKLIENKSYTQTTVDQVYASQKSYLDVLSVSKYLVNGNHEQEAKYLLDGTNTNPAILAKNARAKYFDSPGAENGYYSFTKGNALFVIIDFYWHSDNAVDNVAGAKSTAKKQQDLWNNTLGQEQYKWLKTTLENSTAKYKFVFTHHVLGTGRGGIENAKLYEWGGYNSKGIYEFDKMRPGWGLPIHQLMVKNNVTIFFQGHDHLFAKQELDGIIYQTVPNPADDTYTAFNKDAYKSGDILPNSGFLDVTVSSDNVKVDYIKSGQNSNGQSIYSYTIGKISDASNISTVKTITAPTVSTIAGGFIFDVEADPHMDEQSSADIYKQSLQNIKNDNPAFLIDLGDIFMVDKLADKSQTNIQNRYVLMKSYYDMLGSAPLYFAMGNHDGEAGWDKLNTKSYRQTYFPSQTYDKNYYSFEKENALFVILDPYTFTITKPNSNGWDWTLGKTQYDWLKTTLENSKVKYKFVFLHQLVGGDNQGRGGVEFAKLYEWGGNNLDGSYGFSTNRPGWAKPIAQLLADNKVNIVFKGHDHFYAKQELNGVIYQTVPQPSHPGDKIDTAQNYGYLQGEILGGSGYLRVSVSESKYTVQFVKANGAVATSYSN